MIFRQSNILEGVPRPKHRFIFIWDSRWSVIQIQDTLKQLGTKQMGIFLKPAKTVMTSIWTKLVIHSDIHNFFSSKNQYSFIFRTR